MNAKKLIFLDIDGTLISPGANTPPESALKAIRAAQEKGHRVFLCTGRNRSMTAPVAAYGFDGAIMSAGGLIACGDESIYDHPMSSADRDDLLQALKEGGAFPILEAGDVAYADGQFQDFVAKAGNAGGGSEAKRWKTALEKDLGVLPISRYRGEPVYKITFACLDERQLDAAKARVLDRFQLCLQSLFSSFVLGEFIQRAFDKGRAIGKVCAYYGVPLSDTIGFGDSMNDLEMIESAGIGVCMENGNTALKARADCICPPVEHDGLAAAFARLGLAEVMRKAWNERN